MKQDNNQVEFIMKTIKSNKICAIIIVVSIAIIGLGSLVNSIDIVAKFSNNYTSETTISAISTVVISTCIGILCLSLVLICIKWRKLKLERAKVHIETRLKKRGGNRASFDAIREIVNKKYSDNFLEKLIDMYPETFGTCLIKREKGNKKGITLVAMEE